MEVLGGRGGIAPTHSRPRHQMGVSGQHHAPAALYPRGKDPRYPLYRRLGGPQSRSGHRGYRKILSPLPGSNPDRTAVQPVARHYTAWANRLTDGYKYNNISLRWLSVKEWVVQGRVVPHSCQEVFRLDPRADTPFLALFLKINSQFSLSLTIVLVQKWQTVTVYTQI
jgi:hypothetical protein